MVARTRTVAALAVAIVLGVGQLPAAGQDDPAAGAPDGRTLEEALQDDLGLTATGFAQAGAAVEAATERWGLGEPMAGTDAPRVGVLEDGRVELLDATELAADGAAFTDLDQLRSRYLDEVGPDGLTGLAYTLEGYEVLVAEPARARAEAWAAAYPGVRVVGTTDPAAAATVRGGTPLSFGSAACTHGFNGWYAGAQIGLAAGHCAYAGGTSVFRGSERLGTVTWWQFGAPGSAWESYGTDLATYSLGGSHSYPAAISNGSDAITITGRAAAVLGMPVCRMGRQTGWTCATVNKVGWQWIGDGSGDISRPKRWVWSLFADTRVIPGDSGGPWVSGHKAVGVTSSYDWYSDGRPYSTAALLTSLDEFRPGAQVKVWLGTPTPDGVEKVGSTTGLARWSKGQVVKGTLSRLAGDHVSPGTVIEVTVDGTRVASPSVASDGTFSFSHPGSDAAGHVVTLRPRAGDSRGTTFTVHDEPAGTAPTVVRHAGEDRYRTAAAIAEAHFPSGADTVYVASGESFPDALSGGALAGSVHAPVLLTRPGSLPGATAAALRRLAPSRIVVLGGTAAASDAVVTELRGLAGTVERISGADRYAVSAAVASAYPAGVSTVYVASGESFPDALGASAQAGARDVPLLLTRAGVLPSAVRNELERLDPARIVVVGGPAAVTEEVVTALRAHAPTVVRVSGADRYAVSAALARISGETGEAWVASGASFPDALTSAPVAASVGAPVLLTRPDGLPSVVGTTLEGLRPPVLRVAGGTASVSTDVTRALRWLTYAS